MLSVWNGPRKHRGVTAKPMMLVMGIPLVAFLLLGGVILMFGMGNPLMLILGGSSSLG